MNLGMKNTKWIKNVSSDRYEVKKRYICFIVEIIRPNRRTVEALKQQIMHCFGNHFAMLLPLMLLVAIVRLRSASWLNAVSAS